MAHQVLKPSFVRHDARGLFVEVLNGGHWEALLTGSMNPGAVLGHHYHKETLVFFYLLSGMVHIRTLSVNTGERDAIELRSGEGIMLHTNESHAIHFSEPSNYIMLKSKQYDPANPDTFEMRVD
jgi:quercetin dioxygenase-like cupin family protein